MTVAQMGHTKACLGREGGGTALMCSRLATDIDSHFIINKASSSFSKETRVDLE